MKYSKWCVAGALLGSLAGQVQASGLYVGLGFGPTSNDMNSAATVRRNDLIASGYSAVSSSAEESNASAKVYLGHRFSDYFALEVGYADLGSYQLKSSGSGGTSINYYDDLSYTAVFVDGLALLPVGKSTELFARLGIASTKTLLEGHYSTSLGAIGNSTASATERNLKLGLGAQFNFSPSFGVRAEAETYRKVGKAGTTGESDLSVFSLGLTYRF